MSSVGIAERSMASRDGDLGELEGVDVDERALVGPADRRAGSGDDHGVGHGCVLPQMVRATLRVA